LTGAATVGTFGVTVVMGQEYLPGRIGLAAGVTMGLSIGLGGEHLCSASWPIARASRRRCSP
jgi:hypothetical protein